MTREEAQVRNYNIFRLRGTLPGITKLVPKDVIRNLPHGHVDKLEEIVSDIINELNKARDKKYIN